MLMRWLLLLVSIAAGQEVHDRPEDTSLNTTTLYPTNKTLNINRNYHNYTKIQKENNVIKESSAKQNGNITDKFEVTLPKKVRVTTWAIDAHYVQPKNGQSHAAYNQPEEKETEIVQAQPKEKDRVVQAQPKEKEISPYNAQPKDEATDDSNSTDSKEQLSVERSRNNSEEKKFKPSPHLGNFFDDDNLNLLKFSTSDPFIATEKNPANNFLRSKDFYMLDYQSPKDTYRDELEAPYRHESSHFLTTDNWKQTLESKPTVESSVKIPAGGLYKHSNSFKEKPNSDAIDDDFGLSFSGDGKLKENPIKKRSNPWSSFVQLMTAFLPVGLIISALTPSIMTLHSSVNDPYLVRGRASRRAGGGGVGGGGDLADVPAISERCRRRLLCEIHAEENYLRSQDMSGHVRKHCYKLRCEEPHDLRRVLAWLLAHRPRSSHQPPPRPDHYTDMVNYHYKNDNYT